MILAGIDEAGYGPVLGPLVVGACAFELDGDPTVDAPCLWKQLRKLVSKKRVASAMKIHVNDSKLVYSSSAGLKELERGILSVAAAWDEMPADLEGLLARVAPRVLPDMVRYPWYRAQWQGRFPLEQDAISVKLFANALRAEMERVKTRCVHLAARVICEGELNRMFDATRNKSNVLFSVAAGHLDDLLRAFGRKDLVIICDRQGGRGHYGPLLRLMFEEWGLEIVSETESRSEYRLLQYGHAVRIVFVEKAEVGCMPVALASMLSKYLREALMARFNAYWQEQLPGVNPTAGYHTDGIRFLGDIEQKRRELGVVDAQLIRSR
jgi:ribonuclease HII